MNSSDAEKGHMTEGLGYLRESLGEYFKENSALAIIILILIIILIIYTINRSYGNLYWLLGGL